MTRLFFYLEKNKEKINKITPFVLLVYVSFVSFPYIFARIEVLDNIFSSSLTSYVIRGILIFLYSLFGIALIIANKYKWKPHWLIMLSVLIILSIVNQYVSPSVVKGYTLYFTGRVQYKTVTVGNYQRNLEIIRFIGNCLFLYFMLTAYPFSLKERKNFRLIFIPTIVISLIAVIYTISIEGEAFSNVILNKEGSDVIRSIFHSKNEYGIFLFEASVAITFLFYFDNSKKVRWLILLVPMYLVFALLINCKAALLAIGLMLFLFYLYSSLRLYNRHQKLSIGLLLLLSLLLMFFILFLTIDGMHTSGAFKKLYDNIVDAFSSFSFRSAEERQAIWGLVPIMTRGIYILIGFSSAVGGHVVTMLSSTEGEISTGVYSLHNAYVDFYAYHGVIGILFLAALYGYIIYNLYLLFKKDKCLSILIALIFIVSILFSNIETYMMFISMSANTFTLSMIILAVPLYMNQKEKNQNA